MQIILRISFILISKDLCHLFLAISLLSSEHIAALNKDNAYTLERLDTNNLPKDAKKEANIWTKKVYI